MRTTHKVVDTEGAARILCEYGVPVSTRTLQTWRAANRGPAFFRVGSRVFYAPDDLVDFVDNGRTCPSASPERCAG